MLSCFHTLLQDQTQLLGLLRRELTWLLIIKRKHSVSTQQLVGSPGDVWSRWPSEKGSTGHSVGDIQPSQGPQLLRVAMLKCRMGMNIGQCTLAIRLPTRMKPLLRWKQIANHVCHDKAKDITTHTGYQCKAI